MANIASMFGKLNRTSVDRMGPASMPFAVGALLRSATCVAGLMVTTDMAIPQSVGSTRRTPNLTIICNARLPSLTEGPHFHIERPCGARLVGDVPSFIGDRRRRDEKSSGLSLKRSRAHGTSMTASITM